MVRLLEKLCPDWLNPKFHYKRLYDVEMLFRFDASSYTYIDRKGSPFSIVLFYEEDL